MMSDEDGAFNLHTHTRNVFPLFLKFEGPPKRGGGCVGMGVWCVGVGRGGGGVLLTPRPRPPGSAPEVSITTICFQIDCSICIFLFGTSFKLMIH